MRARARFSESGSSEGVDDSLRSLVAGAGCVACCDVVTQPARHAATQHGDPRRREALSRVMKRCARVAGRDARRDVGPDMRRSGGDARWRAARRASTSVRSCTSPASCPQAAAMSSPRVAAPS